MRTCVLKVNFSSGWYFSNKEKDGAGNPPFDAGFEVCLIFELSA